MEKLASEVHRVLKLDTYAIIDLLSKYSLDRILHTSYNIHSCSLDWIKTNDKTAVRLYTPSSARKLFKNSGFEIEKIIGVTILADRGLPFRKIFEKHHRLGQIESNLEKIVTSYFPFNVLSHALIVVVHKD